MRTGSALETSMCWAGRDDMTGLICGVRHEDPVSSTEPFGRRGAAYLRAGFACDPSARRFSETGWPLEPMAVQGDASGLVSAIHDGLQGSACMTAAHSARIIAPSAAGASSVSPLP